MSSAFEYGRNFGQNFGDALGKASKSSSDGFAIDEILTQANATGTPKDIDSAMQQILSRVSAERRPEAMQLLQSQAKRAQENATKTRIVNNLQTKGLSKEDADLYVDLTTGGQTAFAKDILEGRKRGINTLTQPQGGAGPQVQATPEDEFKSYLSENDAGLTPAEKVARGKERFATGSSIYTENTNKLRSLERDKERFNILESLDKSGKLPKDMGRLNVKSDGNLALPYLASPESQRFVKTLNEFSAGAKDTFGSRVTNFDLQQYLLRYPTLLNSVDGRRQVIEQMKIVNSINKSYASNLKKVYDDAGGSRNIDSDAAERFAEKLSKPEVDQLATKFAEIGSFESLPSAKEFKGKKILNEATGERLVSDGINWNPETKDGL